MVSDDSVELPAPLLPGQVEALETVGICMLVEYMLAPPGAEEPQQLRAFWPDASAATPVSDSEPKNELELAGVAAMASS